MGKLKFQEMGKLLIFTSSTSEKDKLRLKLANTDILQPFSTTYA